jgi:general secretion pathway protein M
MTAIGKMDASQQRRLAIGLLVVAVLLLLSVTILPVATANRTLNSELDALHERLQRLEAIASQDEELRARYAQLRRNQATRGYFLQGDSEAVASADLQRILKDITSAHATQLMSTQILPAVSEDSLTRVSLRVRIRGPMEGLVESLYELESNSVLLFLDNITIRTAVSIRQRLRVTNPNPPFEANFDLTAYMTEAQ